jgi:Bacterial Ig-like domain
VDHAPLHALSDAAAGGNGVFLRSSTGGFPTNSSMATNYWVDVAFIDSGAFAPQIVSVTPAPGSFQVPTTSAPTVTFSEPMDSSSVNESTVLLVDVWNDSVPSTISYDANAFKVTITPAQPLQPGSLYTVTIKGGAEAPHITDATGTPLASDYTWSFAATISPSTLPILVITATGNNFTQYYTEILRSEGFNSVNAMDITQITSSMLAQYDVAILGETPLTSAQVTMLSNWVTAGGNLIAMRPDKQLASLLGIADASSVQPDAYLLVNTAQETGAGIISQTIQYHGTAYLYTLNGATSVASIYSNPTQVTSNPAVTLHSIGTNGGQAVAFTFDLARSIVYTRQGNPAWAGEDRDGIPPIRTNDLFFGGADPDRVNLDKVAIPKADEWVATTSPTASRALINCDQGTLRQSNRPAFLLAGQNQQAHFGGRECTMSARLSGENRGSPPTDSFRSI